jgi:vancomycin resistance protein YoaR
MIDNIPVGGETAADALQSVKSAVLQQLSKIDFCCRDVSGGESYHYTVKDFAGYFDTAPAVASALTAPAGTHISLPLKVDSRLVQLHVLRLAANWREPVQEPRVTFDGTTVDSVAPGHTGRSVDQTAAVQAVLTNLPTLDSPSVVDNIPINKVQPIVQPDDVTGLADTLISFTTTFNPANQTRTNNLLLAVRNINGTVVGPGEVFSYNDSVGPRTQKTGFQDAIIYVNDRMKKDVGGGICQASSTLYNCVLLANLPIVERHAHSLPVHYVPAGRDATVAWGGDDFKFRNNTSKPIIVRAVATRSGVLTESLIGDRNSLPHPEAKVSIAVSPKRTYPDGFAVTSYRVVTEDGVQIAREPLGVSFYHNLVGDVPH